jgi:hypothetical protein
MAGWEAQPGIQIKAARNRINRFRVIIPAEKY